MAEPKPIQEILAETMAIIKERSNKYYETATPKRETAMATAFKPQIDFNVGDIIQVCSGDYAGRIGRIIGIKLSENGHKHEMLTYTIMFSDTEAVQLPAGRLRFLSTSDADI